MALQLECHHINQCNKAKLALYTVNGERFTELNFHVFHGFQENRKVFHEYLFILHNLHMMALF